MRRALIIGASGQDGRLLARFLQHRGYNVQGWTRVASADVTPCECAAVDLLQSDLVEREIRSLRPDEIYYLAAYHHSTEDSIELSASELLQRSFEVHVSGLLNVLSAVKNSCPATRLFYAASSHVFGTPAGDRVDESTPFEPNSAYGVSKAAGIQCCQISRKDGVFAACGILFNHESSLRKPSFLSQKIVSGAVRAKHDPTFRLKLGDLEARVDWGYAPDYVEAMFRILQLLEPEDFVIATGEMHSVREFAEIAFDAVGLDGRCHVETDPSLLKRRSLAFCGDARKLRTATAWRPTIDFGEMVRGLVAEASEKSVRSPAPFASPVELAPRFSAAAVGR